MINLLNRTFVTPLDRDDMYRLASVIDDVCDHIDEAADNIDAVRGEGRAGERAGAGRRLYRAAVAAARGGRAARGLQATRSSSCTRCASSRTRATGSRARRSPTSSAPARTRSTIIRWKDIHEQLEEAVDACENAADVLEAILVKNR